MSPGRILRIVSLSVNVLAYSLPFVTLSCPGGRQTLSGVDLVAGTTVEEPRTLGPPAQRHIDGNLLAGAALLTATLGLVLASRPGRLGPTSAVGSGALCAFLLLLLQAKLGDDVQRESRGIVQTGWRSGYWLALSSAIAAAFAGLLPADDPPARAAETSDPSGPALAAHRGLTGTRPS